tara:strand:+ start:18795 stop:18923 length:129 start_codon:yes stop_codon:yes gene_type:complete
MSEWQSIGELAERLVEKSLARANKEKPNKARVLLKTIRKKKR